ncbi:MAG TPA: LysM peptidoglycan-binding domain-containing protein [Candidatus Dormibacteraeota bacterium]|nr:LysM peptidoglycan-binding domain-containing protein [Candidatus Dormibacteraeota bacterium]
MYAAGYGIKPWRATRTGGALRLRRWLLAGGAVVGAAIVLAAAAHGDTRAATTVVVEPGDTLWSIAAAHYPSDDVRIRVQDIEQANGLRGPQIEAGQTLKLPG